MVRFFLLVLLVLFLLNCSSSIEAIEAEYKQFQESCTVVQDSILYQKYNINNQSKIIVEYGYYLDKEKRYYFSNCAPFFYNSPSQFLKSTSEDSSVSGRVFYAFNKNSQIFLHLVCGAGGLGASVAVPVNSSNKYLQITETDGVFSCQVVTDPNSKPMLRPSQKYDE